MIEDKLSPDERRRLESVAQAIAFVTIALPNRTLNDVIGTAKEIDKYIRGDDSDVLAS